MVNCSRLFYIDQLKSLWLIITAYAVQYTIKDLTTAKTFNVLVCMFLICHINYYTLVPATLYFLRPGGHPRLETESEGGEGAETGNELYGNGMTI